MFFLLKNKGYLLYNFSYKYTAIPGVIRYIFSGQDARTTRVLSFNFVPHKIRNRCIQNVLIKLLLICEYLCFDITHFL